MRMDSVCQFADGFGKAGLLLVAIGDDFVGDEPMVRTVLNTLRTKALLDHFARRLECYRDEGARGGAGRPCEEAPLGRPSRDELDVEAMKAERLRRRECR